MTLSTYYTDVSIICFLKVKWSEPGLAKTFVRREQFYNTNSGWLTSVENFFYFSHHWALEGLFILIELYQRHLKACTEAILLFGFSVLTYVKLKPIKFWTRELPVPVIKNACSFVPRW
jgi:hypothetical protein